VRDNIGTGYDRLLKLIFIEAHGDYDPEDPNHADEIAVMSDYFSSEKLPNLYSPGREAWIKARAAQWIEYLQREKPKF
jgi:hypothetical protein